MLFCTALLVWAAALTSVGAQSNSSYFSPNSTGLKLQNGFERVFIQPFGNHGVRVRASLMRDPTGNEPSALLDPPIEGPGGNAGLAYDTLIPYQGYGGLRNGNLLVSVNLGMLYFYRVETNGSLSLLLAEYLDTKALPARYYVQDFRSSSFESQFSFSSDPNEQIFGVGQQACCNDTSVNKKGLVVDLINFNSQVPIPVYMSSKGYLQFFNVASQGRLDFSPLKTRLISSEASVIDYYITTAEPGDYDSLQQQYTAVTGRQPTPPDFILGFQQSKNRYYNQSQVLEVAQGFHDRNLSVSMIVIDFFAWKYQGDWSFDPTYWPDPAGMAATVKNLTGAEMMVSMWPSVEDLSVNYLPLQESGFLATTRDGPGVVDSFNGVYTRLIDSTNPGSREFMWKQMNESYFSNGIHNIWLDQADGGTLGDDTENLLQPITAIPYARSFAQYYIGTQEATGKHYPWLHQQAIDEGLNNLTGRVTTDTSCEYMSLSRSTFAGGQRFCSYMWSGDTMSFFETMTQQVAVGVSAAASGISAWTLDIGGYQGLNVSTAYGQQLFVRWLSMGTFLPFMRVHGNRACNLPYPSVPAFANPCPNEPWSYGDDNYPIIKSYIELRYQLVPYVKTLFQMLQSTGRTIMRPLYYDFSLSDEFVANATGANNPLVTGQFMMGPRILVSPIVVENATSKEVYLPILPASMTAQNFTWTHWWSEKDFGRGGSTFEVDAPLDQIPVFYLGKKSDIFSANI